MLIFLLVCSLIFTMILIWASLLESPHRFWIKLIACAQFVILAYVARYTTILSPDDNAILIGLVFAFFGDTFLGLRKVSSVFFLMGILMFTLTHLAYLSAMVFQWDMLKAFGVLALSQGLFIYFSSRGKTIKVHGLIKPLIILYDLCLIAVASLSFVTLLASPIPAIRFRFIASMAFLISDTILFGVYFVKPKTKPQIIAYLALYHLAQTLYAVSLWL